MCKLKTSTRLVLSLLIQIWFQGPLLQAVSPTVPPANAFPPFSCMLNFFVCFFSAQLSATFSSWISTWPQEPYWEKRAKGEATEAGVDDVALVCHTSAALQTEVDLSRLRKHTLRKQGGTGSKNTHELFYLHLAQGNAAPCVLSPQLLLLYSDVVIRILAPSDSSNSCLPQLRTPAL